MKITLTIDGQRVSVPRGVTVLEAAREAGIFIPTFCHDPEFAKPGACRICVVEIPGMRNLPASCVTEAADGMVVSTQSPAVIEARRTILELLLANHPLDCLTCDKSGDCRLQDYAYRYGVRQPSFTGERHQYEIDDSNPYIIRDNNKCILCGKCVLTCQAVADRQVIDFAYRGFNTKITTAMDLPLGESDCVFCGRCVAVCPVGALTLKPLQGKGRHWEVDKQPVTCEFCDSGCSFYLIRKQGEVVGITPAKPGEGRPLCLKGRLGTEFVHNSELTDLPLMKKDGNFIPVSWDEALGLTGVMKKLQALVNKE